MLYKTDVGDDEGADNDEENKNDDITPVNNHIHIWFGISAHDYSIYDTNNKVDLDNKNQLVDNKIWDIGLSLILNRKTVFYSWNQ